MSNTHKKCLKLAINGFGRIGRNVLRAYLERQLNGEVLDVNIVAINDLSDANTLLHLLKYDSAQGRLDSRIECQIIGNQLRIHLPKHTFAIQLLNEPEPEKLPWQTYQVDVVLESTGHFRSYQNASRHLSAGAKQVIIGAAPFDRVDASIVLGVNESELTRDKAILSSVSCTTQALVPLLDILDQAYGIELAMLIEIHAVTADQNVLDQVHRDLRRARASGHNIIPTTSSSINAVSRVLPQMAGKINGYSIRVPTIDVAAIDVTFKLAKNTSVSEINRLLKQASQAQFQGIMGYTDEPLVSSDFIHEPDSLVIDSLQTMQVGEGDNQLFKVFAWYDNEWGYANRMLDMCEKLSKLE